MTDPGPQPQQPLFPPMHPVTRLGRVIQQLRSFDDLHASELDALATQLEAAGATEAAAKIRVFRDVQRGEGDLVVDELVDIQQAVSQAAQPTLPEPDPRRRSLAPKTPGATRPSARKWLAEEARREAEARAPRTRRDLFSRFSQ